MDVPFLLSEAQMRRIEPFFPLSPGILRVDDRRIVSGIVYVIKHGLMWRDAPRHTALPMITGRRPTRSDQEAPMKTPGIIARAPQRTMPNIAFEDRFPPCAVVP